MTIPLVDAAESERPIELEPDPLLALAHSATAEAVSPHSGLIRSIGAAAELLGRAIATGAVCQVTDEPIEIGVTVAGSPEDVRAHSFLEMALSGVHMSDTSARPDGLQYDSYITVQYIASKGLLGIRFARTMPRPPVAQRSGLGSFLCGLTAKRKAVADRPALVTYSVSTGFLAS